MPAVPTQRKAAPSAEQKFAIAAEAEPTAVSGSVAEAEQPAMEPAAVDHAAVAAEVQTGPAAADMPPTAEEATLLLAAANERLLPVDDVGGLDVVEGDPIPIYPTSVPPSQTLRYDLQRGMLSGTGEMSWRRDPPERPGATYELQLQAKIGGLTIVTQISKGGFDKAGLAPIRFTDQRLRGSVRAANFQRQRRLITFSGPSVEYPLVRGVQDRLSWMVQVPAILAANPQLASPGRRITMYVIGARGDAAIWDFKYESKERISTEAGEVQALKFSRQPRKPFDTLAEVWLDPAHQYMPLRARIGNPEDGAMLELKRID